MAINSVYNAHTHTHRHIHTHKNSKDIVNFKDRNSAITPQGWNIPAAQHCNTQTA